MKFFFRGIVPTIVMALFILSQSFAQFTGDEGWRIVENTEKMKIYTRIPENSKFKEIKMDLVIEATPRQIHEFISVAALFKEWVYTCSEGYSIEMPDGSDVYYIRFDMMWPLSDRDIVQRSESHVDEKTGVIDISTKAIHGHVPIKPDVVRVTDNKIVWKIIPIGKNRSRIKYYARNNPGGQVPAWLMNMVATVGPKKTIDKMVHMVESQNWKS
jgi:hypothetical protein